MNFDLSTSASFIDHFEVSQNLHIYFYCDRVDIKLKTNKKSIMLDKQMWFQLTNYLPLTYNACLTSESFTNMICGSYPTITLNAIGNDNGKIQFKTKEKMNGVLSVEDARALIVISTLVTHLCSQQTSEEMKEME